MDLRPFAGVALCVLGICGAATRAQNSDAQTLERRELLFDSRELRFDVRDLTFTTSNLNNSVVDIESSRKTAVRLAADVLFAFDVATLAPASTPIMNELAARISAHAAGPVQVDGYTDSIGAAAYNLDLSNRRAKSVVEALKVRGVTLPLEAAGHGAEDPVARNKKEDGSDNPVGRALNRRVTVMFPKN
jgi:outer membrane protein OmpA-like peptidoglycan-associated protein